MVDIFRFCDSNSQLDSLNFQNQNYFSLIFFETNGRYQLNEETKTAVTGEILFLNNTVRQSLSHLEGLGWFLASESNILVQALTVQPTGDVRETRSGNNLLLHPILNSQQEKIYHFCIPIEKQFKWIMRLNWLEEELNRSHSFSNSAILAIIKLLAIDLVRLSAAQSVTKLPDCDPLLNRVFDFIESHYHEAISLSDVAKKVNKSTSYLTNLVKQKTGRTVLQWIVELRMAKARSLLLETNYSVETIAETVGYLDLRHFSRQFRRIHGSSPKQWKLLQLQSSHLHHPNSYIAE